MLDFISSGGMVRETDVMPASAAQGPHDNLNRVMHTTPKLILASRSSTRAELLRRAGLEIDAVPARIDEGAIKSALMAADAHPRDIADALAEGKARKVSGSHSGFVIGCDQILACDGRVFSKPQTREAALEQLTELRGRTHRLYSAAVVYEEAQPVWRHVSRVRLTMRESSDAYLADYVDRNWDSICQSVGAYRIEEEGIRLFKRVEGDYFAILGIPLLEILSYLTERGTLPA